MKLTLTFLFLFVISLVSSITLCLLTSSFIEFLTMFFLTFFICVIGLVLYHTFVYLACTIFDKKYDI
jgi:hypothetical protein